MNPVVIDVYHDDNFDPAWPQDLKSSGILAVIHKATQGLKGKDAKFHDRKKALQAAGFLFGSYHFGTSDGQARDQAKAYLDYAKPSARELVCLDFEEYSANQMSWQQAEHFVMEVHDQIGRYPLLYIGYSFLKTQAESIPCNSLLRQCRLWVARYSSSLGVLPQAWPWALWQFTDKGNVPGIVNPCDFNQYNGTKEELVQRWPYL